ncbi:TIGR01457 family HAD-type hydrolase [Aquibacillus koreensis]|uniref:Acid sugar phosphatase n=1 Tax=Aquibacillus koreensis TaxID=279446 RepID=A0A9X3WN20_9BACI|nr:TIGR01457 family HAD-type hydrolase [Aquibacillus koreensis]MCT2534461.1 TIGR01457 family HAD-type hydrolase [Aquibacillus koreensis]MDC3421768.1 TIGR01457 family HAD-type hydrolase [Aquibacillus koreensis]
MNKYRGFLIDLDGTVYKGTEKIEEAITFVKELEKRNLPYLFLTNNSTKHPSKVSETLVSMGVPSTTEHVFTTSMATAKYISELKQGARVYPIGEEGLISALKETGLEIVETDADFVVMGLDRTINYEKLAKGALNIRAGAKFVATNGDIALPTERGFLPGAGSLISVLSVTTGVEPKFIGKPESIIVDQALEVLGTSKEETLMVGDNYATDILAGINAGIDTLLVHTGVTTKEHLLDIQTQPTYAIDTLAEWLFDES